MSFHWTNNSIRWYAQAAEACSFHQEIAKRLTTHLTKEDIVCDLGCGLGYLDFSIAPYVKTIKAIDTDPLAFSFLTNRLINSPTNIIPIFSDYKDYLSTSPVDIVLMSFFGNIRDIKHFYEFYNFCKKKFIYIVNGEKASQLSPTNTSPLREKVYAKEFAYFLEEHSIPYHFESVTLEFGQPFSTYEDAIDFLTHYYPHCTRKEQEKFLNITLQQTTNGFYLPNQKEIGIFIIEKEKHTYENIS